MPPPLAPYLERIADLERALSDRVLVGLTEAEREECLSSYVREKTPLLISLTNALAAKNGLTVKEPT